MSINERSCQLEFPGCPSKTSFMFRVQKFGCKDLVDACANCWSALVNEQSYIPRPLAMQGGASQEIGDML